jgi:thiol:disulfide interchange protein
MKKVTIALLLTISLFATGQVKQFVTWKFSSKKISADEFELQFKASIEKGWHLYSQIETPDILFKKDRSRLNIKIIDANDDVIKYRKVNEPQGQTFTISRKNVDSVIYAEGPLPTLFEFEKSKDYILVGKTTEPKPHEVREPLFNDSIVRSFENSAVFTQRIKALTENPFVVKGFIDGMSCNDNTCSKFSPPADFEFKLEGAKVSGIIPSDTATQHSDSIAEVETTPSSSINEDEPEFIQAPEKENDATYWKLFIAGFLGGLAALLTPCVFPMIPMTVSFFTKQSKTKVAGIRNAIIYSISIIAIYIILGLGVTLIFGADAMNNLATNVWFNLAFFALLVVFAISFLGAFEITLPSSFVNKMDARSDRGGLIGIFFMAFTLGLVSFSCTGPIIGTLLVQAASTGALAGPFFGMFGFSLALALPFGLFAAFPGWLNSLPKSGGWLNSVKVVLGFLELALAMKFLSNADLVVQAFIITREVFLIIWIVIFALMGAYLMGWFRLAHDSDLRYIPVGRLLLAIITFSFTFYLIPGLWGAPLKLISGFPPPDFYSESPEGFGGRKISASASGPSDTILADHAHRGPNGIPAFNDYYHGLAYAKKVNKPAMIDFTGWACVNCRKMEGQVWSDSDVKKMLSEDFVLISLYVDDKKHLPDELKKEVVWNGSRRRLNSVGDRWSYLQNTKYKSSTQPQYWIIDADEKRYSEPTSYDPDIKKYLRWLNKGLQKYRQDRQ